jgi:hypothetical protein
MTIGITVSSATLDQNANFGNTNKKILNGI